MDNSSLKDVEVVNSGDGEGRQLYAIAVERRGPRGTWVPDEITHIHAFSAGNARATFWLSVPPAEQSSVRIVSVGLSIGGHATNEHADEVIL